MQLRSGIFLWLFPAAAVPLAVLLLATNLYNERRFLEGVDADAQANLASVVASMERRLLIERDLATRLAATRVVQSFAHMIDAPDTPGYQARWEEVNQFIETFQTVRTSLATVRITNWDGETIVRVKSGRRSQVGDEIGGIAFVGEETINPDSLSQLQGLKAGEIGSVDAMQGSTQGDMPVFMTATPIVAAGVVMGFLLTEAPLEPLSRMLNTVPRFHGSRLLVAEINSEAEARDGLVIYDDSREFSLLDAVADQKLVMQYPELHAVVGEGEQGSVSSDSSRYRFFYQEYYPYPGRLVSWLVATRVDLEKVLAPFRQFRLLLGIGLAAALALSLILVHLVSNWIVRPARNLTEALRCFESGERSCRIAPLGPSELAKTSHAFNSMSDTVVALEHERDKAEAAMLKTEKLATVGRMAAGIGHEISNPLNNIMTLTKLLQRQLADNESAQREVREIRQELGRATKIIRNIVNFAREAKPSLSDFFIRDLLDETVRLMQDSLTEKSVNVVIHLERDVLLTADRGLLQQVLLNLLTNALHASPENGQINLSAAKLDTAVEIKIQDMGPGVQQEMLERVFDPFVTTKAPGEGSGLGLAISQAIIEKHGGSLVLTNRSEGGAEALIRLPLDDGKNSD